MKCADALDGVVTLLQAVDGTGGYTHDFTDSDAIQYGVPTPDVLRPPCVWINTGSFGTPDDDSTFGELGREFVLEFYAASGQNGQTNRDRMMSALHLLDDICRALDGQRLGVEGYGLTVDAPDLNGGEIIANGPPMVAGTITIRFLTDIGEGA